ncbi:MAG: ATP-binding cassette domain-containing protein, partial [Planctomycetota bacterium]|nr:ATP-binding cassette domain-containing protein [Planctomycetota bacterium]
MATDPENTGRVHVIPRTPVVRMQDICKRFGGTVANVSVHFTLTEGEVHALVGENGAGKTTLMNILYGLHWPDSGRIEVFGRTVRHHSPADAIRAGIGMVHQHFMLVPTLSAAENVALGREPTRLGFVYMRREAEQKFESIAREFGFKVAPGALVRNLSVGERQEVEIIKALSRNARIVILDEPTSVLSGIESERLFATVRSMAAAGKSVVFITHRLREVIDLADTVTVLRKGIVVATMPTAAASVPELSRLMIGAESVTLVPPLSAPRPALHVLTKEQATPPTTEPPRAAAPACPVQSQSDAASGGEGASPPTAPAGADAAGAGAGAIAALRPGVAPAAAGTELPLVIRRLVV